MRTPKVLHDIKIHDIKPHSITRYQASQYGAKISKGEVISFKIKLTRALKLEKETLLNPNIAHTLDGEGWWIKQKMKYISIL